jgi:hypothetical protein
MYPARLSLYSEDQHTGTDLLTTTENRPGVSLCTSMNVDVANLRSSTELQEYEDFNNKISLLILNDKRNEI